MTTEMSTLTPGGVSFAVDIQMGKIPSKDPLAFAYGFKTGLEAQSEEPEGDDLAPAYIEGYKLAWKVRAGTRPMPPWAKVKTGTIPPLPGADLTAKIKANRTKVADLVRARAPWFPTSVAELDFTPFPIPNLEEVGVDDENFKRAVDEDGDEIRDIMVDHSGFGREGERALTQDQFIRRLKHEIEAGLGYGYAVVDVGQFQLFVRVFQRKE